MTLDVTVETAGHNFTCHRTLHVGHLFRPLIHEQQTATPQVLVRLLHPSAEEDLLREDLPAFNVTPILSGRVALPNLLAEVLHPQCHWSHELDNSLEDEDEDD